MLLILLALIYCANAQTYQIPIEDFDDNMYLINLTLGTPPQTFTVQLDTASADFWVVDSTCTSKQCIGKTQRKKQFNSTASRTYSDDGTEFLIEYNHHGVEGIIGQDVMAVGDINVKGQSFGRGMLLDQIFGTMPLDGIFGLGLPQLSQTGIKGPLQSILDQLERKSFTLWLDR